MPLMFEIYSVGGNTPTNPPPSPRPYASLEQAKECGLEAVGNGACVWIEGMVVRNSTKTPVPMWGFRYDKEVRSWVETSLPFNIEEFFNTSAPQPL